MAETIIRPAAAASGRVTPASFPFYTSGEDNLRVSSYNSATGVSLKINGRLIDASGKTNSDSWDHIPNTDRSVKITDITLSGSTLLNITIFASAGAPQIGQTFVKVQLIRGIGAGAIVLGTILQGYVTFSQALGFPGSAIELSQDGPGCIRAITGTHQASGFDFSETVPVGARWELLQVFAFLQAGTSVGTRFTELRTMSGAAVMTLVASASGVPGSGTGHFQWAPNLPVYAPADDDTRQQPIPSPTMLIAGESFLAFTLGLTLFDQWTGPFYKVREWIDVI